MDQKTPRRADIELAAGGRTKQGNAAVKGRLSIRGLKHMQGGVISMLVADRRWLTIWHYDWPDETLLGLVPKVTGRRLGRQDVQEG